MKSRIVIGLTSSTQVQAGFAAPPARITQPLHQAFMDQETLAIRYRNEGGDTSDRRIEPHYLLLKYPVWYVVAFDHLRETQRTFRCDRILEAETTGIRFQLAPKETFRASLEVDGLQI